jgi:hypothetical protein
MVVMVAVTIGPGCLRDFVEQTEHSVTYFPVFSLEYTGQHDSITGGAVEFEGVAGDPIVAYGGALRAAILEEGDDRASSVLVGPRLYCGGWAWSDALEGHLVVTPGGLQYTRYDNGDDCLGVAGEITARLVWAAGRLQALPRKYTGGRLAKRRSLRIGLALKLGVGIGWEDGDLVVGRALGAGIWVTFGEFIVHWRGREPLEEPSQSGEFDSLFR